MRIAQQNIETDVASKCEACAFERQRIVSTISFCEFLGLPLFPTAQSHKQICIHCNAITESEEVFPTPAKMSFQVMKKFFGMALICILLSLWFLNSYYYDHNEQQILKSPDVFDFYIVDLNLLGLNKNDGYQLAIAKVVDVSDKEVKFRLGTYSYKTERNVMRDIRSDKLLINNYFSKVTHQFRRTELVEKRNNGQILKAMRPENLSLFGGLVITQREIIESKLNNLLNSLYKT